MLQKILYRLRREGNLSKNKSTDKVIENVKKDIITYEALQNTEVYPSFSTCGETQMNELKKCVILPTLVQFTILHGNNKHIIIRGWYGSGKSIVLRKRLEKCLNEKDIFYYICCDQKSKFMCFMESIKSAFPDKHIVTCNSKEFTEYNQQPTLSVILSHIHHFWKNKTVHIFIDEFPGSLISKKEVSKLKEIMPEFTDSFIIIALQSMEEFINDDIVDNIDDDKLDKIDVGYRYDLLKESFSFEIYNLSHSWRCSVEINEFVKITSKCLETDRIPVSQVETFFDIGKFVDKEYGKEMTLWDDESQQKKKISYSLVNHCGHSTFAGPVSVFIYDKYNSRTACISKASNKEHHSVITQKIYIATLQYILTNLSKYKNTVDRGNVICTYDKELYNCVYNLLENDPLLGKKWTNDIREFMEPGCVKYNILLTDYASIRGLEFTNVIILLRLGGKFLKYRMIECFTRATTNLYIITDNINTSKGSTDDSLMKIWRLISRDYVNCFDICYDYSDYKLQIYQDNETKFEKNLNSFSVGRSKMFPWGIPNKVGEEQNNMQKNLYFTICYLCENDNINVVLEFFRVNHLDIFNYCGQNLLHTSSTVGCIKIIKYLLSECQIDVESVDCHYRTPLHYAAMYGHLDVVKILIENNASIDREDKYGQTAPYIAQINGHLEVVKLLTGNEMSIQVTCESGSTAIPLCARDGKVDSITEFI